MALTTAIDALNERGETDAADVLERMLKQVEAPRKRGEATVSKTEMANRPLRRAILQALVAAGDDGMNSVAIRDQVDGIASTQKAASLINQLAARKLVRIGSESGRIRYWSTDQGAAALASGAEL
jgi:arginine utilization protein RocB